MRMKLPYRPASLFGMKFLPILVKTDVASRGRRPSMGRVVPVTRMRRERGNEIFNFVMCYQQRDEKVPLSKFLETLDAPLVLTPMLT